MKKNHEKLVTRTIKAVSVSAQVYNLSKGCLENRSEIMPFAFNKMGPAAQLQFTREKMETETERVLTVSVSGIISEKYAISESDFIKYGHKMTKEEEEENEEEGEEEEG